MSGTREHSYFLLSSQEFNDKINVIYFHYVVQNVSLLYSLCTSITFQRTYEGFVAPRTAGWDLTKDRERRIRTEFLAGVTYGPPPACTAASQSLSFGLLDSSIASRIEQSKTYCDTINPILEVTGYLIVAQAWN